MYHLIFCVTGVFTGTSGVEDSDFHYSSSRVSTCRRPHPGELGCFTVSPSFL